MVLVDVVVLLEVELDVVVLELVDEIDVELVEEVDVDEVEVDVLVVELVEVVDDVVCEVDVVDELDVEVVAGREVLVVVVGAGMPRYAHCENSDVPPSPVAVAVTNQLVVIAGESWQPMSA